MATTFSFTTYLKRSLVRPLKAVLVVSLSSLALTGCGDKVDNKKNDDEVSRGAYLIDRGQYSEAIYSLSTRIKRHPEDLRARVLLASAYSARAGIKLASYIDFAATLQQFGKEEDVFRAPAYLASNGGKADAKTIVLREISKTIWRVQITLRAFDTIPTVQSKEAYEDLKAAHKTLAEAGPLHLGPALYRALLKTALVKHEFWMDDRLSRLETSFRECGPQSEEIKTLLGTLSLDVQEILEDVAASSQNAELKERMHKFVNSMNRGLIQVQMALNAGAAILYMNGINRNSRVSSSCR